MYVLAQISVLAAVGSHQCSKEDNGRGLDKTSRVSGLINQRRGCLARSCEGS